MDWISYTGEIRQSLKVPRRKNIAVARWRIGEDRGELIAVSGQKTLENCRVR